MALKNESKMRDIYDLHEDGITKMILNYCGSSSQNVEDIEDPVCDSEMSMTETIAELLEVTIGGKIDDVHCKIHEAVFNAIVHFRSTSRKCGRMLKFEEMFSLSLKEDPNWYGEDDYVPTVEDLEEYQMLKLILGGVSLTFLDVFLVANCMDANVKIFTSDGKKGSTLEYYMGSDYCDLLMTRLQWVIHFNWVSRKFSVLSVDYQVEYRTLNLLPTTQVMHQIMERHWNLWDSAAMNHRRPLVTIGF